MLLVEQKSCLSNPKFSQASSVQFPVLVSDGGGLSEFDDKNSISMASSSSSPSITRKVLVGLPSFSFPAAISRGR